MKSHTSAISSTCRLFILGFTLIQGYDAFAYEDILTSNPSCYGATFDSFVNADCGYNSRLIFPLEVFVGAKPNSTGCKTYDDEYGENDPLREQCCGHIDGDHDCRDEYDGENRTVFMTNCVGRNKCEQTRTVWKSTIDMGCNVSETYKEVSNYAYLEYYCIAKTRMGTPMKDLKLRSRGNPLYLTAGSVDAYWDGILENNVTCSVKTSNKSVVEVWTMDVRLNMSTLQHVEIDNGASLKILDNSYNNSFHPTLILNDTYSVNITLKTNKHNAEFIWLGFRANSSNDFVEISCDESGRFYIADQDVPLSEAEKTIGLMIGSAAGGLCFLAICIILGIVIYRRYSFRKVGEEIKNLPENEEIE